MSKKKNEFKHSNELVNFYDRCPSAPKSFNPNPLMPKSPHRTLIIGGTGSMKSNTLLNIIEKSCCYTRIYLITKQPDEPLYEYLQNKLKDIKSLDGITDVLTVSDDINDVPNLKDVDKTQQNLLIVDDMIGEGKKVLEQKLGNIFTMGRKSNLSCIFISQNYFSIPKKLRTNSEYFILKSLSSKRDKNMICSDLGIESKELINLIDKVQEIDKKNFIMIDQNGNIPKNMKFRINFEPIEEGFLD